MSTLEDAQVPKFPEALTPIYRTPRINRSLLLASGKMVLSQSDREWPATQGRIFLKWLPSPAARFELTNVRFVLPNGNGDGRPPVLLRLDSADLLLPRRGDSYPVEILGCSTVEGPCTGVLRQTSRRSVSAERVIFHVPNFHPYCGDCIETKTSMHRGRLVIAHDSWRITIDAVEDADKLRKQLASEGGFAITNVGRLERQGGESFDLAEATDVLDALYYFLTFCRGIWCGPVLPVAYSGGREVWREWVPDRYRPWALRWSWFPHAVRNPAPALSAAFGGLLERWETPLWQEPLKNAIHWYTEANLNAGGVEGGIILALTALDLLGWIHLVEDSQPVPQTARISAKKFDKMNLAARIKRLLEALDVPLAIPKSLSQLWVTTQTPSDGATVLVRLRNALVHPKRSNRAMISKAGFPARIEALSLSLNFVELALLRLFGYTGQYHTRLEIGGANSASASPVPWSTT